MFIFGAYVKSKNPYRWELGADVCSACFWAAPLLSCRGFSLLLGMSNRHMVVLEEICLKIMMSSWRQNLKGKSHYSMKKYVRTVYVPNKSNKDSEHVSLGHLQGRNSALFLLRIILLWIIWDVAGTSWTQLPVANTQGYECGPLSPSCPCCSSWGMNSSGSKGSPQSLQLPLP